MWPGLILQIGMWLNSPPEERASTCSLEVGRTTPCKDDSCMRLVARSCILCRRQPATWGALGHGLAVHPSRMRGALTRRDPPPSSRPTLSVCNSGM